VVKRCRGSDESGYGIDWCGWILSGVYPSPAFPPVRRKSDYFFVFDPRIFPDDVVMPILKKWRIFGREDFTGEAAAMRDDSADSSRRPATSSRWPSSAGSSVRPAGPRSAPPIERWAHRF
jgi:hypothetical protein